MRRKTIIIREMSKNGRFVITKVHVVAVVMFRKGDKADERSDEKRGQAFVKWYQCP